MGIIVVLLALLVPVFGVLRDSSDTARCASNFRSIGAAVQLFMQDFNGEFTSTTYYNGSHDNDPDNPGQTRPPGMRDYLGFPKKVTGVDSVFTCPALQRTYPTRGYALNHNYAINAYATVVELAKTKGYKRIVNIAKPSSMAYFMDGAPGVQDYRGYAFSSYVDEKPRQLDGLVFPHRGSQQVLFLDGHIELLNREQFEKRSADVNGFWKGQN